MSRQIRIGVWFAATFLLFFTRAFLFSTWLSRAPEAQESLGLNDAEMGWLAMVYPAGSLVGIFFANGWTNRFGSRMVALFGYGSAGLGLGVLGFALESGNTWLAVICLFVMGFPMGIGDYIANYEGNMVDKATTRSLFPALHGGFGVGMLLAAGISSAVIAQGVLLQWHYLVIALMFLAAASWASLALPKHPRVTQDPIAAKQNRAQLAAVWKEKRSLLLAVIGFSFIMAEVSAGTWVPIALTRTGFTAADAAATFGLFWVIVAIGRLVGGFIVEAIGRFRTVLLSALITASGITVFMLVDVVSLPILGLVLWGLGMAIGFPMTVAAMGDDPAMASARINMIITVVYISSVSVGPAMGAVGEAFGIYVAFAIPLIMMVLTAILSPITKPLPNVPKDDR